MHPYAIATIQLFIRSNSPLCPCGPCGPGTPQTATFRMTSPVGVSLGVILGDRHAHLTEER